MPGGASHDNTTSTDSLWRQLHKSSKHSHLVIHDDLIGGRVQQRGHREHVAPFLLVLHAMCLLHVVGREHVQGLHLVLLEVRVRQVGVGTRRLQDAHEVVDMILLVVFQLRGREQDRAIIVNVSTTID